METKATRRYGMGDDFRNRLRDAQANSVVLVLDGEEDDADGDED